MGVIVDTSVLIACEREAIDLNVFMRGRKQESVGISVITNAQRASASPFTFLYADVSA